MYWYKFIGSLNFAGNFYANLFKDSVDAADQLGSNLGSVVSDIANLHTPFMKSSLPISLQDMLINSLSHVRWVCTLYVHSNFYNVMYLYMQAYS